MKRAKREKRIEQYVIELTRTPMKKWHLKINALPSHVRSEITREANEMAVHLARLAAYAQYVDAAQHSPSETDRMTHSHACSAQNEAARRVRRALYYTYPKADITWDI
jgi:hypothetical protein